VQEDDIEDKCALLVHHAASSGNFNDVSGQPIGSIFTGQESFLGSKAFFFLDS
jgi:hypothetical protein